MGSEGKIRGKQGFGGSSQLVCAGMGGMGGARGAAVGGRTWVSGRLLGHTWVQRLGWEVEAGGTFSAPADVALRAFLVGFACAGAGVAAVDGGEASRLQRRQKGSFVKALTPANGSSCWSGCLETHTNVCLWLDVDRRFSQT